MTSIMVVRAIPVPAVVHARLDKERPDFGVLDKHTKHETLRKNMKRCPLSSTASSSPPLQQSHQHAQGRRSRKRQMASVAASAADDWNQNPYLVAMGLLGILYLIVIFGLACWECLFSTARVQRLLHQASLATETGPTPFEYHHQSLLAEAASSSSTTATPSPSAQKWKRMLGNDNDESAWSFGDSFSWNDNNDDEDATVVDDDTNFVVDVLPDGMIQPPKPRYRTLSAASHIQSERGVLEDGTLFYRCGDWSTAPSRSSALDPSRDVVFLSAQTFFNQPVCDDALLVFGDDNSGARAFMELCHRSQQVASGIVDSITILDLNESVPPAQLQAALRELRDLGMVSTLPVAALVTPSAASAATIVDWILYGSDDELASLRTNVARNWIVADGDMSPLAFDPAHGYVHAPHHVVATTMTTHTDEGADENDTTASGIVRSHRGRMVSSPSFSIHVSPLYSFMAAHGGWPILSVYGERDVVGKKHADLLRDMAQAVVAEIGNVGTNVLVEAPREFAETMLTYLEQETLFQNRSFRKGRQVR
jgi:hypothetical protein